MGKKRPERTERRVRERAARQLVRDRERLAGLLPGGAKDHPIPVDSASVVEVRVRSLVCPQCGGSYRIIAHEAPASGLREVTVTCSMCGVSRSVWFRLVSREPN